MFVSDPVSLRRQVVTWLRKVAVARRAVVRLSFGRVLVPREARVF